jgi:hypothetical protein
MSWPYSIAICNNSVMLRRIMTEDPMAMPASFKGGPSAGTRIGRYISAPPGSESGVWAATKRLASWRRIIVRETCFHHLNLLAYLTLAQTHKKIEKLLGRQAPLSHRGKRLPCHWRSPCKV